MLLSLLGQGAWVATWNSHGKFAKLKEGEKSYRVTARIKALVFIYSFVHSCILEAFISYLSAIFRHLGNQSVRLSRTKILHLSSLQSGRNRLCRQGGLHQGWEGRIPRFQAGRNLEIRRGQHCRLLLVTPLLRQRLPSLLGGSNT